jgi:branched-chain amino acid transport system substrate-binding protein
MSQYMAGFKAKYNDDLYTGSMISHLSICSPKPWPKAGSTDPVKVAAAMHGHEIQGLSTATWKCAS